jgi:A/G-specific adenine glycosylase
MDYGVLLKKTMKNPARRSKHHTRQSTFEGSDRQLRGRVIRILLKNDGQLVAEIVKLLSDDPQRGENIIQGLVRDEIVHIKTNRLHLGAAGV